MDEEKQPHLRLIENSKDTLPPHHPELHYYVNNEMYDYKLGMEKKDIKLLVIAGVLLGILTGIVAVGIMGGFALML